MTSAKTTSTRALTEKKMRRAVSDRDPAFDGRFYYAVVTTGVVCRPSCAARPARPENLRFYDDLATAIDAGFRPCKRCRPDQLSAPQALMIDIARYIDAHFEQRITLKDLGTRFGMSSTQLQRKFKSMFSISPKEYQDGLRTRRFQSLLKDGEDVSGAIYEAGFGSPSRVYGEAARNIGMTPGAYRAGGTGETIYYAYRDTALGPLMMAATSRGVCFAQFGSSEKALTTQLKAEFPNADLQVSASKQAPELNDWIAALDAHLESRAPRPDLPLDLRGTAFQISVWRFLLNTKEGDVVSYAEVAAGIEKPKAFRAAATACGANRVAVLVPCHRVLRGDGQIGGYRWGVERKRALLDGERKRRAAQ